MSVAAKTWSVGEVVTAANMNTYLRDNLADLQTNKCVIYTGTYTGDGSTGQAVTGVGFTPVFLWISQVATDGDGTTSYWTWTDFIARDAKGFATQETGAIHGIRDSRIVAFGADGFTVSDDAADEHPNKNTTVYSFIAIGAE